MGIRLTSRGSATSDRTEQDANPSEAKKERR